MLVTAPINKYSLELAGRGHEGHTEMLMEMTGSPWSMTVFLLDSMRVAFFSRHLSLAQAIAAINAEAICEQLVRLASSAPTLGLTDPLIGVAALNPHAGENGLFGREEIDEIEPGIAAARERGIRVEGPIPADAIFHQAREGRYDAVLGLYHDQVSAVLKAIDFHRVVSVTLGLPFLRLSVDHGTAFDIAGTNRADPRNMIETLVRTREALASFARPPSTRRARPDERRESASGGRGRARVRGRLGPAHQRRRRRLRRRSRSADRGRAIAVHGWSEHGDRLRRRQRSRCCATSWSGTPPDAGWATVVRTYESLGWRDPSPLEDKHAARRARSPARAGRRRDRRRAVRDRPAPPEGCPRRRGAGIVSIDRALERARAIKTDRRDRRPSAQRRGDGGGAPGRAGSIAPGRSELAVFADVRLAMETHVGERLPVTGDLLTGVERTAGVMGWPGRRYDRGPETRSSAISRLGSAATGATPATRWWPASRRPDFLRLWTTSKRALGVAAERLRPGITAGDLDAEVRAVIESAGLSNPLHIGHGIGTSSHEWPRIVPGNPAVIEPGMVLMIEPGAYDPRIGGVRLEWMFLVTDSGSEVLSPFEHVLETSSVGASASSADEIAGQGGRE